MRIFCEILLLSLMLSTGCHSHRTTVSHEAARYGRAILDSTVTKADTVSRRDSVVSHWLTKAVSLEWDSVDYHLVWDSAGQVSRVTGSRRSSRRSGSVASKAVESTQAVSHSTESTSTVVSDSLRHELSQDREVESKAGADVSSPLHWLEIVLMAILLALAVAGVIHLRELTDRWSKR